MASAYPDSLYQQAMHEVTTQRRASAAFIMQTLHMGYRRASAILDILERDGVVSPRDDSGRREIRLPLP